MTISRVFFVLVVIFGSSSWLGTNSVWVQLPLLTADLPEEWSLPSFLATIVQIACVGPLVYGILHKGCKSVNVPTVPLITAFLTLACFCELCLVFTWWWTVRIGVQEYSLALYVLLFGLALVNASSNVLFMPFMAQFHHSYLNAYFVGMGFSSLIPSLLSLVQGAGKYECEGNVQRFLPPQFGVSSFFLVIFCWTATASVSFKVLCRRDEHKSLALKNKDRELRSTKTVHEEATLLNESKTKPTDNTDLTEEGEDSSTEVAVKEPVSPVPVIKGSAYAIVLVATALVNAQMNGVIPSVHSYAALPYSQDTYHYGIVLANVVSPLASFLPFIMTIKPPLPFNPTCLSNVEESIPAPTLTIRRSGTPYNEEKCRNAA